MEDVIIVGAGVAGLSAAEHLLEHGVQVKILEADNRWGGRVNTQSFGASLVEVGANWIHGGCYENVAFNLANREAEKMPDLLRVDGQGEVQRLSRRKGFFYKDDGTGCIDQDLGEKAYDLFFQIERDSTEQFLNSDGRGRTLQEYFDEKCREETKKFQQSEQADVKAIFRGMENYAKFHAGDELTLCNLCEYGSYRDLPGGDVKIPGGYINVFRSLHERVKDRLEYGKEVVRIQRGQEGVTVKCKDQSQYRAKTVIITVSLGYLKKHHETMFEPPLPASKVDAIEKIGFGRAGKVFLEFDSPFWSEGEEVMKIARVEKGTKGKEENWSDSVLGFDEVINNRRALVCWIGGRAVEIMEKTDEKEVLSTLTDLLRRCTGDPSLPAPVRALKTGWVTHPLYLGSYSYGGMRTESPAHQLRLAEPVLDGAGFPALLFAGEATHEFSYSTVHGARASGLREAGRIVKFIKNLN